MIRVVSEKISGFSFEPTAESVQPCISSDISEDSMSNLQGLGTSRKRRIKDPGLPSKKPRLSLNSPEAQKLYEKAITKLEDGKLSELPLVFKCEIKYRLWEGRRKIRRQLVKPGMQEIMDLEKRISKLLVDESRNHEESFTESISTVSAISTGFLADVRVCSEGTRLHFVFAYDKAKDSPSNCNAEQDFKNMAHHLKLSLPSMVKKCMRHK